MCRFMPSFIAFTVNTDGYLSYSYDDGYIQFLVGMDRARETAVKQTAMKRDRTASRPGHEQTTASTRGPPNIAGIKRRLTRINNNGMRKKQNITNVQTRFPTRRRLGQTEIYRYGRVICTTTSRNRNGVVSVVRLTNSPAAAAAAARVRFF